MIALTHGLTRGLWESLWYSTLQIIKFTCTH